MLNKLYCILRDVRSPEVSDRNPNLQALSVEVSSGYSGQDGGNYSGSIYRNTDLSDFHLSCKNGFDSGERASPCLFVRGGLPVS